MMPDRISKPSATGRLGVPATGGLIATNGSKKRMLNRQRTILALINEAGGEASHLAVTKWAFLLREECSTGGGSAFYQFLPYKYGPFSFCLFQEASLLARDGLIEDADRKRWKLTSAGASAARDVQSKVRTDVQRVVRDHGRKSFSALIEYVYDRHPWYTVNSEVRQLDNRADAEPAVYTAGYEGLLVDGFLNGLMQSGIRRLIDVRNNPVSRRYGFHKTTLARLCNSVGIEYAHFPQLGIASQQRRDLDRPGARAALFDEYARTTLADEDDAIESVARLMKESPSVLVCMEAAPCDCHRSRLAEPVAHKTALPVRHLELWS